MDENSKTKEEQEAETEYLREAIRMVELRMNEQDKAAGEIQRKAVLLITFCVAIGSFAYSGEPGETLKEGSWLSYLIAAVYFLMALVFIKSIYHGIKVLDLGAWRVPGANPDYVLYEGFSNNYNQLARGWLEDLEKVFHENEKINEQKAEELTTARWWGVRAMGAAFILVVAEKIIQYL